MKAAQTTADQAKHNKRTVNNPGHPQARMMVDAFDLLVDGSYRGVVEALALILAR